MKKFLSVLSIVLFLSILITGCQEAVPNRPLTMEQKLTDFKVLVSQIRENYALTEYKEQRFGFKLADLEQKFIQKIMLTKNNSEFYAALNEFVATFGDAHFSINFRPSSLKGASEIAVLGMLGIKHGDNILVTELHPLVQGIENFPLQPGDQIIRINKISVKDYINKELVPYRNLGREESNHTFLAKSLFQRSSLSGNLPKEKYVSLTYSSAENGKILTVELPWIVRDYADFQFEIAKLKENPFVLHVTDKVTGTKFPMTFYQANQRPINLQKAFAANSSIESIADRISRFEFDAVDGWTSAHIKKHLSFVTAQGRESLALERKIPEDVLFIEEAQTYPAYIESVKTSTGKTKNIGYIRIGTFSPDAGQEEVLEQLWITLRKFEKHGVKDIVLDLLDNPGGSLSLVTNVAQAFSNKKIKTIDMKFGLNENWLNNFHSMSTSIGRGSEAVIADDVLKELTIDYEKGAKISSKSYPVESFMPFGINVNYELQTKFNILALVSEGNASSGDIIAYLLKRNGLAVLAGQNTMGAGGNVVKHLQAPHSHFEARLTESALVMEDGQFLENNGVKPDMYVDLQKFKYNQYRDFIRRAFEIVSNNATFVELQKIAKAKPEAAKLLEKHCDLFLVKVKP
ncbi:MAG: hypothetical protein JNM93_02210 [Bacteriovoracaceae bacterium]|nr:hypothetical protein [Bacteriovoracaceae bacterium]